MQSMLRLPAAYGYYAACGTPSAVYGVSAQGQARFQRLVGKSTAAASRESKGDFERGEEALSSSSSVTSQSSCDAGRAVCRGFTCDFLIHAGVPCAHLVAVWGCQGCLECSSCWGKAGANLEELNVLSEEEAGLTREGSQPYVCPRCSDLKPPLVQDRASSVTAEHCDGLAEGFQSCVEANQQGEAVFPEPSALSSAPVAASSSSSGGVALIVDDPPADSPSEMCPMPSSLPGLDVASLFPLIVFELPIESVVAFLSKLPAAPPVTKSSARNGYAVSPLGANWVDEERFLHRAADLLIRT